MKPSPILIFWLSLSDHQTDWPVAWAYHRSSFTTLSAQSPSKSSGSLMIVGSPLWTVAST